MKRTHLRQTLLAAFLLCVGLVAHAAEWDRIDGSSDAAAQESFEHMRKSLPPQEQQRLLIAMLRLNLIGVSSAVEVASRPDLQNFSPARIRDKIKNLTAKEIIDLADRTSNVSVRIEETTN